MQDVFLPSLRFSGGRRAHRLTCPPRKDEADWLVELTGEAGSAYRASPSELEDLGLAKVPVTAEEFHSKWRESAGGKAIDQASAHRLALPLLLLVLLLVLMLLRFSYINAKLLQLVEGRASRQSHTNRIARVLVLAAASAGRGCQARNTNSFAVITLGCHRMNSRGFSAPNCRISLSSSINTATTAEPCLTFSFEPERLTLLYPGARTRRSWRVRESWRERSGRRSTRTSTPSPGGTTKSCASRES